MLVSNVSNVESPGSTLQVSYSFSCAYEFARIFFRSIVKSLEICMLRSGKEENQTKTRTALHSEFLDHRVRLKIAVSDQKRKLGELDV